MALQEFFLATLCRGVIWTHASRRVAPWPGTFWTTLDLPTELQRRGYIQTNFISVTMFNSPEIRVQLMIQKDHKVGYDVEKASVA